MSTATKVLTVKKRQSNSLTTGLALFSMFFGAGNLVFPLLIGKMVGQNVWYAVAGLGLMAVFVPFLGLTSMVLFQGDYHRFFGRLGKIPGALLLLLLQLLAGPLGVIPRLFTLMHATAAPYLNGISITVFNLLLAGLIFACSFRRDKLVGFLGAFLTPVLLFSMAALIFFGLKDASPLHTTSLTVADSFVEGVIGGYNMMDLIGAFLFTTVVLPHFQKEKENEDLTQTRALFLKKIVSSGCIAVVLLFITYAGLCLISAQHGEAFDAACPTEKLLGIIAHKLLGPVGGAIAAISVITACLTTAITMVSIFADYLRKDICKEKISSNLSLSITLLATTLFANLGFERIAVFLAPILQIIYPAMILLAILNLLYALYGYSVLKIPLYFVLVSSMIFYFLKKII